MLVDSDHERSIIENQRSDEGLQTPGTTTNAIESFSVVTNASTKKWDINSIKSGRPN